jgi:carboxylesterase
LKILDFSQYAKPISFQSNSSNIGILVVHGFGSTPQSIEYYCKKLHQAGFHIEAPCLTGHAARWKAMNQLTYHDWIRDVEVSYKKIKERASQVFIAGLSMGGALALKIAQQYPDISGIILINHAVFLNRDWRMLFLPIIMQFMTSTPAKVGGDLKDPDAYEITYGRIPLKGTFQLLKLLKNVRKSHKNIKQPVVLFKSTEDHVIPAGSAFYTMKYIASKEKELIWLNHSCHVATMDFDKDFIVEKSIQFVKKHQY